MKPRKLIRLFKRKTFLKRLRLSERGQSIVEFVLLLAAIAGLSYGFMYVMNKNIVLVWEYAANLVVNDKPGGPKAVSFD
jgi:hypothetical protein